MKLKEEEEKKKKNGSKFKEHSIRCSVPASAQLILILVVHSITAIYSSYLWVVHPKGKIYFAQISTCGLAQLQILANTRL